MDRVRLYDDERLDIPDTLALQTLVYEYVGRMLGAFLGRPPHESTHAFGGWLTCKTSEDNGPQPFTYSDGSVSVSEGQFYSAVFLNQGVHGEILRYQPSATQQDTIALDISSFVANKTSFYIWAYPEEKDANPDNRKFWDATNGVETTGNVVTRTVQAMGFATSTSNTPPAASAGVYPFKIGKVISYNEADGSPNILPIFAWDVRLSESIADLDGSSYYHGLVDTTEGGFQNGGMGLIGHLHWMRTVVATLFDANYQNTGSKWISPFQKTFSSAFQADDGIGLRQLDHQLRKIERVLDENGLTEAGEFKDVANDAEQFSSKMEHLKTITNSGNLFCRAWARYDETGKLLDYSSGVFGTSILPGGGVGASGQGSPGGIVRVSTGVYSVRFYYHKPGATTHSVEDSYFTIALFGPGSSVA
jgi:hypothetical protein